MLYEDSVEFKKFALERKLANLDNSSQFKEAPALAPLIKDDRILFPGTKPMVVIDYCNKNYGEISNNRSLGMKGTKYVGSLGAGNSGPVNWNYTDINSTSVPFYGISPASYFTNLEYIWPEYYTHCDDKSLPYSAIMNGTNGGSFSYTMSAHLPDNAWFRPVYVASATNYSILETKTYSDATSGVAFSLSGSDNAPGWIGGTCIISGDNLDTQWNNGNGNTPIMLGFKGLNSTDSTTTHGWWSYYTTSHTIREYKFNSEHFRQIGTNCYGFYDEKMFPVNSVYSGFSYFGPILFDAGITAAQSNLNSPNVQTINYNSIGLNISGTVVSTESFIQPADETDCAIVCEPSGSAPFDLQNESSNCRQTYYIHDSKTQTKLYLYPKKCGDQYYPYGWPVGTNCQNTTNIFNFANAKKIVAFKKAAKYITLLGLPSGLTTLPKTWINCDNVQNIYCTDSNAHLTNVTALPTSWKHLNNLRYSCNLFNGNTILKTLPVSWNGLDNLEWADSMFANCTALVKIPESWEGFAAKVVPGQKSGISQQYYYMFANCTSLTKIPKLDKYWVNILRLPCSSFFGNCTSLTQTYDGEKSLVKICDYLADLITKYEITNTYTHIFTGCTGFADYQEAYTKYSGKFF